MNTQGNLFEDDRYTPPRQRHSETSTEAAKSIKPHISGLHTRILALLKQRGAHGATDEEMQDVLGMIANTQRPRRIELQKKGVIVQAPMRRKTKKGRGANVWILKEYA